MIETPEIGDESSPRSLLINRQKWLFLLIKDHFVVLWKGRWFFLEFVSSIKLLNRQELSVTGEGKDDHYFI